MGSYAFNAERVSRALFPSPALKASFLPTKDQSQLNAKAQLQHPDVLFGHMVQWKMILLPS